jgi:hypothetical protein
MVVEVVSPVAATLVVATSAAFPVVARVQHRLSPVAAHVLAAEVSADWLADPNSPMEAVGCLPLGRTGSSGSCRTDR